MPIDYTTTTDYINWVNTNTTGHINWVNTNTTDYINWVNTEWNTGDWWYRRLDELREAERTKLEEIYLNSAYYNGLFGGIYRTATETNEDNEDFDTTEINKYLETLREEVAVTED